MMMEEMNVRVQGVNENKENKKKQKMEYVIEGDVAKFTTSQGIEFTVDAEDAERVSQYRWHVNDNGYVKGRVTGKNVRLHRFLLGVESDNTLMVDHINHDTLNNCKGNLRICSNQENQRNRKDVKGYRELPNGKYQVYIVLDGKFHNLGCYDTPEQANSIRVMAEKRHFKQYSSKVDLFEDPDILALYEQAISSIEYLHQNKYRIDEDENVVYVAVSSKDITKEFVVNLEDYHIIKDYKWCINKGQIVGWINGEIQQLSRFLLGLTKADRTKKVKFKDKNNLNFRRENLKIIECKTKTKNEESKMI